MPPAVETAPPAVEVGRLPTASGLVPVAGGLLPTARGLLANPRERPAGENAPRVRRWRSSNCWVGRPYGPPIAFVVHTASGGESGTVAEFLNSSSHLSAHYSVAADGGLDCCIDIGDRAWGNGVLEPGNCWAAIASDRGVDPALNPNHVTIVCETEDDGDASHAVSESQYRAVLYAAWEAKRRYPDSLRYLASHADISPQSRAGCPGDRWIASGRFAQLAADVGLAIVSV